MKNVSGRNASVPMEALFAALASSTAIRVNTDAV